MAGGMSRADLVADLKASLLDAGRVFTAADDADFVRHLNAAVLALNPWRPRVLAGSLSLVAGQVEYPAPVDMASFKATLWGIGGLPQWEDDYPGRLPQVRTGTGAGGKVLWLTPAPSLRQIDLLGASYGFLYYANLALGEAEADTTVSTDDRGLLLLRAQAEALRELAMRDAVRPVSVQGLGGQPKTGTPGWLAQQFLTEFEARARA